MGFSSVDYTGWELKKNNNGIMLYTRSTIGSNIKSVRVVDTVQSTLNGIVALLLDVKDYPTWIDHCTEAKVLKVINAQEQYKYVKVGLPWPFDDRDIVAYFKITQDSVTRQVTLTTTSTPDYMPETPGIVRIVDYQSVYILTPLSKGIVQIEFEFHANPTGAIPAWLINANIISGPFNTTLEMRKVLPQYQGIHYTFISDEKH